MDDKVCRYCDNKEDLVVLDEQGWSEPIVLCPKCYDRLIDSALID